MTTVTKSIPVQIPGAEPIAGMHPIVIIGPNGVGKTRLGVAIARTNGAERVAALRNVEIPDIPMQRFLQAAQEVKSALNQVASEHWRQSFELQNLLSAILAEDREKAVEYRKYREENPASVPDKALFDTRLQRITRAWKRHFPGRNIKLDYEPRVVRTIGKTSSEYPIFRMSEGERTALYLTARVVSCGSPILIVDEPETFFHPVLARALWDDLEEIAEGVRFVYITHDIPFALSRRGAQFAIARSETKADLLPETASLPATVVADILGAASFSISASRLIFCEGKSDSLDVPLLSAWHDCPKTAVVAVGGCAAVRECVSVFNAGAVTSGLQAFGYVDRDGLPDTQLGSEPLVKALPVSEIEGIICIEAIFMAVASYLKIDRTDAAARYARFTQKARDKFKGVLFNKEVLNRAKKRVKAEQISLLNPIKPDENLEAIRAKFSSAVPETGWNEYPKTAFSEEEKRLNGSLSTPFDFLRDFPAKTYYSLVADQLGASTETIFRIVRAALKPPGPSGEDAKSTALRDVVVGALQDHFWPRMI